MNINELELTQLSDSELRQAKGAITTEQLTRTRQKPAGRVAVVTEAYDPRKSGKPWIGRVKHWPVGEKVNLEFGRFCAPDGEAGEVELSARCGEIVRWGQRFARGRTAWWGQVNEDFSIRRIREPEARAIWEATKT